MEKLKIIAKIIRSLFVLLCLYVLFMISDLAKFIIIGGVLLYVFSVTARVIIGNPLKTIFYGVVDLYYYFIRKGKNNCPTGQIIAYTALFGRGKTLSVVHYICGMYYKYNDKLVWDRGRKKFVTQKIYILSNVELTGIPYVDFTNLGQIVEVADKFKAIDLMNDTLTVTLVLGDEFSVQMNSRNFKENIDALFLNTILTCRHHHISLIYDAQRFNHVDALLRQVTTYCIECKKVWRIMLQYKFDAWDLENATSANLLKPLVSFGWFIRNKDYNAYDTLACVGNLKKSVKDGDMLKPIEILELQNSHPANPEVVLTPSKKFIKIQKKKTK